MLENLQVCLIFFNEAQRLLQEPPDRRLENRPEQRLQLCRLLSRTQARGPPSQTLPEPQPGLRCRSPCDALDEEPSASVVR